jgi:hypothetical protein
MSAKLKESIQLFIVIVIERRNFVAKTNLKIPNFCVLNFRITNYFDVRYSNYDNVFYINKIPVCEFLQLRREHALCLDLGKMCSSW